MKRYESAEPPLQVHEEVEDLRAHGDVQRRHRLVAHDERRVGRKGTGDRHALPLPTGELQRPPLAEVGGKPDELEQLGHAAAVAPRFAAVEEHQRLRDDLLDRHQRVERVTGILEHHLHPAPMLPCESARARLERPSLERDLPARPLA